MPVRLVECKAAASPSRLPGLDWAVNPYRGCAHACAYCYAQDVTRFETGSTWGAIIEVKVNIVQRLKKELEKGAKGTYGVGTVTDPYQPLERKFELTRGCLSVLKRAGAETSVLTKSDLILRDVDLLVGWQGVEVGVSMASIQGDVSELLEPGAPGPTRRLEALKSLSDKGVRVYLMAAPIVCDVNDSEDSLRALLRSARETGVRTVMWDKFNPKPIASSRLKRRLAEKGRAAPRSHTLDEAVKIRSILASRCSVEGLELLDAF